jgi:uncharacterized OsmC-like protein
MQALNETPELLNGLPIDALRAIPAGLREAPETGLLTFETRTTWLGGLRSRTVVDGYEAGGQRIARRHVIDADEPVEVLGTDTAPNPQELLFSAMGSCLSAVYAVHASLLGITLRSVRVELRGTLDMRGVVLIADVAPGCPEVQCRVFVDADATPGQLQALHAKALAASPNIYHLTTAIAVRTQLVLEG